MEYRHRSLAVPLVAQSLRAVLHCAAAVKTFPLKKVTIWFVFFFSFFTLFFLVFIAEAGVKGCWRRKEKLTYLAVTSYLLKQLLPFGVFGPLLMPNFRQESS